MEYLYQTADSIQIANHHLAYPFREMKQREINIVIAHGRQFHHCPLDILIMDLRQTLLRIILITDCIDGIIAHHIVLSPNASTISLLRFGPCKPVGVEIVNGRQLIRVTQNHELMNTRIAILYHPAAIAMK
jgi:hypothetical protein